MHGFAEAETEGSEGYFHLRGGIDTSPWVFLVHLHSCNDDIKILKSPVTMFYVYILRTSSNSLYIGQTNNLEKRLKEHQDKNSKSSKYMKYFSSYNLVYSESYPSRSEAMRREWQLKKWTKAKKESLIRGNLKLLKKTLAS